MNQIKRMVLPGLMPSGKPVLNDARWPFFTVDIELTNHCTQNCLFCPRERLTRTKGFIELPLLQNLISQLAEIGSRITFCGMGNPLLHPELRQIGQICQASAIRYGITIQAPALDHDGINRLSDLEPQFIEISLPTIDAQLFPRLYPGQTLDNSLQNIASLVERRGSSRGINIINVYTGVESLSPEAIEEFWTARGLACRIMQCHSRGGNFCEKDFLTASAAKVVKCGLFATHAFITWQGQLLACCHDLTGATAIADLNLVSIKNAGLQKQAIANQTMPWQICEKCDEPAAQRPLPDRPFPESDKARSRFLKRLTQSRN